MALQKSYIWDNVGQTFPESYAKVKDFSLNMSGLTISVDFYVNESQRTAGKSPFTTKTYVIDNFGGISDTILGQMFKGTNEQKIALCYAGLKLLTEFTGAIDV